MFKFQYGDVIAVKHKGLIGEVISVAEGTEYMHVMTCCGYLNGNNNSPLFAETNRGEPACITNMYLEPNEYDVFRPSAPFSSAEITKADKYIYKAMRSKYDLLECLTGKETDGELICVTFSNAIYAAAGRPFKAKKWFNNLVDGELIKQNATA